MKNIKDTFQLIKAIVNIVLHNYKYQSVMVDEKDTLESIKDFKSGLKNNFNSNSKASLDHQKSYKLCQHYIIIREKKRTEMMKIVITFIRILMLIKRLKINPL